MSKNDMDSWIVTNEMLIFKAASKYRNKRVEYDDLMQEARLAAFLALRRYNPEKGWSISSWVFLCVQKHLRDLTVDKMRENSVLSTMDTHKVMRLIEFLSQNPGGQSPVEEEILGQCLNEEINRAAERLLKEAQRNNFLQMLSGIPVKKIAETDCVDARTVRYRLSKANTVMTQHLVQSWCCA